MLGFCGYFSQTSKGLQVFISYSLYIVIIIVTVIDKRSILFLWSNHVLVIFLHPPPSLVKETKILLMCYFVELLPS